jgi:hypothetical protein
MALEREALRQSAEHRRNNANTTSTVPQNVNWPCQACSRSFATENGFMHHRCKDREKLLELQSPVGQAAYSFYAEWMRLKKRSIPDQTRFSASRQYNYFIKFSHWSEKTAIPHPLQFIKLMIEQDIEPILWCRTNTYIMYLQWYDNTYPPRDQFMETLKLLEQKAQDYGVTLNSVYSAIGPSALSKLVKRRKLSPWLLVASPNFLSWIQSLPAQERDMVAEAINFGAFAKKINDQAELANEFRAACEYAHV